MRKNEKSPASGSKPKLRTHYVARRPTNPYIWPPGQRVGIRACLPRAPSLVGLASPKPLAEPDTLNYVKPGIVRVLDSAVNIPPPKLGSAHGNRNRQAWAAALGYRGRYYALKGRPPIQPYRHWPPLLCPQRCREDNKLIYSTLYMTWPVMKH